MTIQVRMMAAQMYREAAKVRQETEQINSSAKRASAGMVSSFGSAGAAMTKWGSQVQWAGRQLEYNFSLPLLLAGTAATKFALDNERAMVRVTKVYGDSAHSATEFQGEIDALGRSFEALSNHFGVNQAEVIGVAGDWAAAGSSGLALAKAVKLTLETMVLGEMEATEATEALIAIQAQYGFTVAELSQTIDTLNVVENETGVSMQGLIDVMQRSAGTARSAGIDVQHLAALTAALVPASGSAAAAGNGLRTMISRLLSPTKDAADIMAEMGMNTNELGWQTLNGAQRLEVMAESFDKLSDAQKAQVSTSVASRYQINRFDVLMRDIINENGYYQKALAASSDATANYNQRVYELNKVLESNPQRLQQMWTILQNAMADIIQPFLPMIVYLAQMLANLAQKFADLDPSIQKLIIGGAALLAVIGLVGRYVGATAVLFGMLGSGASGAIRGIAGLVGWFVTLVKLPFVATAAGVKKLADVFASSTGSISGFAGATAGAARTSMTAVSESATTAGTMADWISTKLAQAQTFVAGFASSTGAMPAAMATAATATATAAGGLATAVATSLGTMPASASAAAAGVSTALLGGIVALQGPLTSAASAAGTAVGTAFVAGAAGATQAQLAGAMFAAALNAFSRIPQLAASAGASTAVGFTGAMSAGIAASSPALQIAGASAAQSVNIGFISAQVLNSPTYAAAGAAAGGTFAAGIAGTAPMAAIAGTASGTAAGGGFVAGAVAMLRGGARGILVAMLATMSLMVKVVWQGALALGRFLLGPWGLAIAAAIALFIAFKDDIVNLWNSIVGAFRDNSSGIANAFAPLVNFFQTAVDAIQSAFNRLPAAVANPIMAVVNFVKTAALKVYEWFSYLNPFQRHSPSLVESVTNGMAVVAQQYKSVGNVGAVFAKAANDLKAYKTLASSLNWDEWSGERIDVAAALPSGLAMFDTLVADLKPLNALLKEQNDLISSQQTVVDGWKSKLNAANKALDAQEKILSKLKDQLDALQDAYDAHESAMNDYANTGIAGQQAMSDAMFENEMAQKKLRLEIMKLEKAGGSVDDIKDKMASLQGEIETLRGQSNDLRAAGAGSDVLGPISDQISAMEAAYAAMGNQANNSPVSELQKQLEELQNQGEMLDLENSIKFDPLTRQIDQLANGMKEMPFEQIMKGIKDEKAAMDALKPSIDAATKAQENQQAIVDKMTEARDALQDRYDTENEKLQGLQDEYSKTRDAISDIEEALRMVTSAAQDAGKALGGASGSVSPALENFRNGVGGDFADVGGTAQIGREGGWEDQSAAIDQMTADIAAETAKGLGAFDIFGPIKEKWNEFKGWWNQNVVPAWNGLTGGIRETFSTLGDGVDASGIGKKFSAAWDGVKEFWDKVKEFGSYLWDLFGPQIIEIWDRISDAFMPAFNKIKDSIEKNIMPIIQGLGDIFKWLWDEVLGPLLAFLGGVFLATLSTVFSTIGNIINPVFDFISDVIASAIQVFRGLIDFLAGVFTGDWSRAWEGLMTVLGGIWSLIWSLVSNAGEILWGIVSGIVEGVVDFFVWLWDMVGDTVMDGVDAVVDWFQDLWDSVVAKVKGMVNAIIGFYKGLWTSSVAIVTGFVGAIVTWFQNMWTRVMEKVNGLRDAAVAGWNALKDRVVAVATNMLTPLVNKFNEIKDKVMGAVNGLKDRAVEGFNTMRDKLLGAWQYVKDKINGIMTGITDFIKGGINTGIKAVNKLIDGLNKVADILPGLDWHIGAIPLLAQGGAIPGQRVGSGFKTSGARAIVGEGNPLHPEFVVPTDPAYRKRATELYQELGKSLGIASDSPEWGIGGIGETIKGWIGKGADLAQKGSEWIANAASGAVSTIFSPLKNLAQGMIDGMTWDFGKKTAQSGLNQVWNWVTGADDAYKKAAGEVGGNGPWRRPLKAYVKTSGFGMRRNPVTGINMLHAGIDLAAAQGTPIYAAAQGVAQRFSGASGLGNYVHIDHGAGLSTNYGHMSAFAGKLGNVMPGDLIGLVGSTGNSTGPHLHYEVRKNGVAQNPLPWMSGKGVPLADGGIVRARMGGTLATIGEAGRDEAVIPLPSNWREMFNSASQQAAVVQRVATMTVQTLIVSGSVQTESLTPTQHVENNTYNFYGDLSFPNVRDGGDAETFLRNLGDL